MATKTVTQYPTGIYTYNDYYSSWQANTVVGSSTGSVAQFSGSSIDYTKVTSITLNILSNDSLGEGGAGYRSYEIGYTTSMSFPSGTVLEDIYLDYDATQNFVLSKTPSITLTSTWYLFVQWVGPPYYPGQFTLNYITITYEDPYKTVKYGTSSGWVNCFVYYGVNGEWIRCNPYYGSGTWVPCSGTG